MRFDEASQSFVVDDDFALPAKFFIKEGYTFPSDTFGRELTQETRVTRCYFENRWGLSMVWGSLTYSSNHDHPWHFNRRPEPEFRWANEFIEEPTLVEVGIIMPEAVTRPAQGFDVGGGIHGGIHYELWGDPVAYVDAPQLRFLVGMVSRFDSHTWVEPEDGPYVEQDDDGRYRLNFSPRKEQPCEDSTPPGSQP